jgi:hypothetical protein
MSNDQLKRQQAKTPQQRLLRVLEQEFHQPPRVAQAILEEALACLERAGSDQLQPGQSRVILTSRQAGHGRALRETPTREVVWTVDAGHEDGEVLRQHGSLNLRRVRLQRLLVEALEQDAVASQEDLAQALHVSVRTIKRDCACLEKQGVYLPTRGRLHGIGRGQTHKAQIVGRWLRGETYDQIALHTHHSLTSIRRYIQTFVRVIQLHQQGFVAAQIGLLVEIGEPLVQEYLTVYQQNNDPAGQARLTEQLQRLTHQGEESQKGGQ